jgi:hypothetical protein
MGVEDDLWIICMAVTASSSLLLHSVSTAIVALSLHRICPQPSFFLSIHL